MLFWLAGQSSRHFVHYFDNVVNADYLAFDFFIFSLETLDFRVDFVLDL